MTSVNFNAAATSALRTLQQSNAQLDATQSRISTGLKIGQAKDNAAYWSISTSMKSDNKALGTVKDALGLGAGTVDTAYQGLDAARAQLDDMKAKLTSALNPSVDRAAVQNDIDAYLSSLKSIASSSVFSGENWLSVNSGVDGYSSQKQVVASYARAADGSVAIETIDIDTSKIALFDANANGNGIISSQATLTAGGKELDFGGNAASGAAPVLQGLDAAVATAGLDAGAAAKAKITLGTFSATGLDKADRLTFDLSLNGSAPKTITLSLSSVTDAGTLATALGNAINATSAFGASAVTVTNTSGVLTIESGATGSASSVSFSNLKAVDGNGALSTITGFTGLNGVANLGDGGKNTVAVTFSAAGLADNEKLQFRFTYNGDMYETSVKNITAATDAADAVKYAATLQSMIDSAKRVSDGATLGGGKVTATRTSATNIDISTVGSGPSQSISITKVTVDGADAATTDANGLLGGVNGAYPGSGNTAAATGDFDRPGTAGDTVSFDMTVYSDNATATGSTATKKTVSFVSTGGDATDAANLQAALDKAFGLGVLTAAAGAAGKINVTTVKTGPNVGILMANAAVTDGDGVKSSTLGLSMVPVSGVGRDLTTTPTKATVTSASTFTGTMAFDAGDSIKFNVTMNDSVKAVTIDKATIDTALGGTTGQITSADEYVTVLNSALAKAGVAGVTAKNDSNVIKFEADTAGNATLSISDVKSSSGSNTISVDEISITSASFKALSTDQQTQLINAYINVVSDKLKAVTSAASNMGSVASRIESQKTFVSTLMDTIDKGVSGLVDADMNEESTKLQALQVKQQLGVQALSIANQSAQNVLSLFRG